MDGLDSPECEACHHEWLFRHIGDVLIGSFFHTCWIVVESLCPKQGNPSVL